MQTPWLGKEEPALQPNILNDVRMFLPHTPLKYL
jgi:hypothetical protein